MLRSMDHPVRALADRPASPTENKSGRFFPQVQAVALRREPKPHLRLLQRIAIPLSQNEKLELQMLGTPNPRACTRPCAGIPATEVERPVLPDARPAVLGSLQRPRAEPSSFQALGPQSHAPGRRHKNRPHRRTPHGYESTPAVLRTTFGFDADPPSQMA